MQSKTVCVLSHTNLIYRDKKKEGRTSNQTKWIKRAHLHAHVCIRDVPLLIISLIVLFKLSKSEVIKPSKAKSSKTERTKPSHTFSILIAVINCIAVDCPRFKFKLEYRGSLSTQFSRRFEKLNASQIIFSALFVYTHSTICANERI